MIIACPECSNPFEIADGHIAPLVQIECPTCSFRMILDFEAANDATLREDGMSIAQGFRDAASYRQAVGAGSGVAVSAAPIEPPVARQPPTEPAAEKPPVRMPTQPAQPPAEPITLEQPIRQPVQPAVEPERPRPRPTLIAHTPPAPRPNVVPVSPPEPVAEPVAERVAERVAEPVFEHPPVLTEAQVETHIGPPPTQPEASAPPTFPLDEVQDDIDVSVDDFEPPPVQPLGTRTPQHTPSREPEPQPPELELAVDTTKPIKEQTVDKPDTGRKRSPAATGLMLVLLLVLLTAGGLMTWSLITTGDPFQKILELTGQAEPAAPAAKPAADAKADGKAAADAKSEG